ncbi:septal ring lytic transglycosylase RlpA family protein [Pseudoduganella eburnea]|uniref:Endolytic peptidoglycan transglycosylase RlpA n=1 Tax=Massilia eburnea TaxID=1776165 RepID=A0A6L6QJ99_9BURK|nr:septal ring lytic transglycosylase RlpA family protein [Massilia eburnea]MTW12251.1 septal ring lytic transglycosylase RlpA family protein [Massilia eburnea]
MKRAFRLLPLAAAALLAACGTTPTETSSRKPPAPVTAKPPPGIPALPAAGSGRGAYYQDDGPGVNPPAGLLETPDAEVRVDPLLPYSNRPYTVFGKTYKPTALGAEFKQRGPGTWYGKKFHGQRTSSGEIYDMYKMTAAHPTLPIPSYARVTNISNGNSVVVRINDRGPFHSTRIIDVSYTAALKLGLLVNGSSQLEVEHIPPAEIERMIAARGSAPAPAPTQQAAPMPKAAPMLVSSSGDEARAAVLGGSTEPGYYLQLGSYSREDGADGLRKRLEASDAGLKLDVEQAGKFYRLFAGPYTSREDAQAAGKALSSNFKLKPIVIER